MASSCSGPSVSSSFVVLYEPGGFRGIPHIDFPSCLSSTCLSQSGRGQGCPAPQKGSRMILSSTIKRQCTARDPLAPRAQVTQRLSTALSCTLAVEHNTTHAVDPHIVVPAPSGTPTPSLEHRTRTRYAILLQCPPHLPLTDYWQIRDSPGIGSSVRVRIITKVHMTTTILKMAIDIAMRMGRRPCILSRSHPESIVPSPPCTGRARLAPAVACTSSLQNLLASRLQP